MDRNNLLELLLLEEEEQRCIVNQMITMNEEAVIYAQPNDGIFTNHKNEGHLIFYNLSSP